MNDRIGCYIQYKKYWCHNNQCNHHGDIGYNGFDSSPFEDQVCPMCGTRSYKSYPPDDIFRKALK